jgi:hypothetical protein
MKWHRIETAPRGVAIVYDEKKGVITDAFIHEPDGRATYGYYNNTAYNVTHWMPWPEPPAAEDRG